MLRTVAKQQFGDSPSHGGGKQDKVSVVRSADGALHGRRHDSGGGVDGERGHGRGARSW